MTDDHKRRAGPIGDVWPGDPDKEPRPDGGATESETSDEEPREEVTMGGPLRMDATPGTVRKSVLEPGDDMPCAPRKLLDTKIVIAGENPYSEAALIVWWVEEP